MSLAFGLTVVTMAYAVGHISGGHFNPAVTLGPLGRQALPGGKVLVYIVAQVLGAIARSAVLYVIATGRAGFTLADGFAANGYGEHSPAGYCARGRHRRRVRCSRSSSCSSSTASPTGARRPASRRSPSAWRSRSSTSSASR